MEIENNHSPLDKGDYGCFLLHIAKIEAAHGV